MAKKQIVITKETAAQFIRDIQETLAASYAMQDSEFFMDGIEAAMQKAGVPKIKGYENPKFDFENDMILFKKAPAVVVK